MTKAPVECIFGGPRIKESDVRDATHARHEPPGKRAERTCMATYNETTREAQEKKFLLSTLHDDEPRARKVTSNGRCGRWVELGTEPVKKKKCLYLLPFIKLFIFKAPTMNECEEARGLRSFAFQKDSNYSKNLLERSV